MPLGGAALDATGVPLPEETLSVAKQSDAVLLGAIGGYLLYLSLPYLTLPISHFITFFCVLCNHFCLITKSYKWDKNEKHLKPETGLLQLREGLKVFANLRPATVFPQVTTFSYCS